MHPQEAGYCSFLGKGDIELNKEALDEGIIVHRCKNGKIISTHTFTKDDCPDWAKRSYHLWDMIKECGINEIQRKKRKSGKPDQENINRLRRGNRG